MPATKGLSGQDVLKVFDRKGSPLTTREIAEALDITLEGARYHLTNLEAEEKVTRKAVGANGLVWFAEVAPALSDETAANAEAASREDAIPLDELDGEFDAA